jgi:hypothetical protein
MRFSCTLSKETDFKAGMFQTDIFDQLNQSKRRIPRKVPRATFKLSVYRR